MFFKEDLNYLLERSSLSYEDKEKLIGIAEKTFINREDFPINAPELNDIINTLKREEIFDSFMKLFNYKRPIITEPESDEPG